MKITVNISNFVEEHGVYPTQEDKYDFLIGGDGSYTQFRVIGKYKTCLKEAKAICRSVGGSEVILCPNV